MQGENHKEVLSTSLFLIVSPDGRTLEALVGCPRWFYEEGFMQKKFSAEYSIKNTAVQAHYKTIQDVCADHPGVDDIVFSDSKKEIVVLPFLCFIENVNFETMMTRTKGVKPVTYKTGHHKQFTATIEVTLVRVKRSLSRPGARGAQVSSNPKSDSSGDNDF